MWDIDVNISDGFGVIITNESWNEGIRNHRCRPSIVHQESQILNIGIPFSNSQKLEVNSDVVMSGKGSNGFRRITLERSKVLKSTASSNVCGSGLRGFISPVSDLCRTSEFREFTHNSSIGEGWRSHEREHSEVSNTEGFIRLDFIVVSFQGHSHTRSSVREEETVSLNGKINVGSVA